MENLGVHNLIELYGCSFDLLDDLPSIEANMVKAAKESGATVLNHFFHKFSPQGVTGAIAISESHLTIHTWPEKGYAALDVFTCGDHINHDKLLHDLKNYFQASKIKVITVDRGILDSVDESDSIPAKILAVS